MADAPWNSWAGLPLNLYTDSLVPRISRRPRLIIALKALTGIWSWLQSVACVLSAMTVDPHFSAPKVMATQPFKSLYYRSYPYLQFHKSKSPENQNFFRTFDVNSCGGRLNLN